VADKFDDLPEEEKKKAKRRWREAEEAEAEDADVDIANLEEKNKKYLAQLNILEQLRDYDDARHQIASLEVKVLKNQMEIIKEDLRLKLERKELSQAEVEAAREELHARQAAIVASEKTLEIVREINEEATEQAVLSKKSYDLALKIGVAWNENLSTSMAISSSFKFAMGLGDKMWSRFTGGVQDLIFSVDKATKAFQRQFQFNEAYNRLLVDQTRNMNEYGVSIEDVTAAHTSLIKLTTDFTMMSVDQQKVLSKTAALAQEQGVAFDDLGRGFQASMKFFGETASGASRVSRELLSTAKALGLAPAELSAKYATMAGNFAKMGNDGVAAFKDIARISKLTGFEMEKILALTDKFDTFEGAAEMTGKLNAALGGNFVNAMDMMMATNPAERFEMIRESLDAAGLSFDDMSYYQRKYYAETLGLKDAGELALLMSGRMDGLSGSVNKSAEDYIEMQKAAQASMNVQEAFQAIIQDNADSLLGLAETLNKVTKFVLENGWVVKTLLGLYAGLKTATFINTILQGRFIAQQAAMQTALLAETAAMQANVLQKEVSTTANIALDRSNKLVATSGWKAMRPLLFIGLAFAGIAAALMIMSPSKLVVAMFGFGKSLSFVSKVGSAARAGLTALAQGLIAVAGPLFAVAAGVTLILGGVAAAAAGIGYMAESFAKLFKSINVDSLGGVAGLMTSIAIGAPFMILAGIGLAAMAAGFMALGLGLLFVSTRDLEAIATFTESIAAIEVGGINNVTKAIEGVADAMNSVPAFKAMALSMTMNATAVATNAARNLIAAGGGQVAVATGAGGGGGATTVSGEIEVKFNHDMFKSEVIKITETRRGEEATAAAQGRAAPLFGGSVPSR